MFICSKQTKVKKECCLIQVNTISQFSLKLSCSSIGHNKEGYLS